MSLSTRQQAVFSRASVQIWMGEFFSHSGGYLVSDLNSVLVLLVCLLSVML